ncbi:MAG: LLM class F420-dependent oxidoreductase [Acidimicrobiales bacterium]
MHPFRFGVSASAAASRMEFVDEARRAEDRGFSTLHVADHLVDQHAPLPALVTAAEATSTLRVGTFVINNDLRHPVLLAREAATVDVLSGGRLELGLGAGHMASEYDEAGLDFDDGRIRVDRLTESVAIIETLLRGEACTFGGSHYAVRDHRIPRGIQRPRPPILIGGNGRRLHELAARHADIVGFVGFTHRDRATRVDLSDFGPEALDRQVARVREAAGERFPRLELNALLQRVIVTDDRRAIAEEEAAASPSVLDPALLLDSPYILLGTTDEMIEQLRERRRRFGISYWVCLAHHADALAPVVEVLAGE